MDKELRSLAEEAKALNSDEKKQKERNKELSLSLGIAAHLNTLDDIMFARGEDLKNIHECMRMWQKLHNRYFYGNDTGYEPQQTDEFAKLKNE